MRKFIQPVAMTVPTYLDWVDLANQLILLGYNAFDENIKDKGFPLTMYTCLTYDPQFPEANYPLFCALTSSSRMWLDGRMIEFKNWNHSLFLATASMSEGPELYPGEYVKIGNSSHLLKVVEASPADQFNLSDGNGGHFLIPIDYLTKASLDEIMHHFLKDDHLHNSEVKACESKPLPNFFKTKYPDDLGKITQTDTSSTIRMRFEDIPTRSRFEESRINGLFAAITSLMMQNKPIPEEWVEELNDLLYRRIARQEP